MNYMLMHDEDCEDYFPEPYEGVVFPGDGEEEDRDPFMLDCGNPECILTEAHFLSECCTVADMEEMSIEAGLP